MFVVSFKTTKKKLLIIGGLILIILAVIVCIGLSKREQPAQTASGQSLLAGDSVERMRFLEQYGWQASEEPEEICEVIIPEEFNEVYENYNAVQKQQEMDLEPYKGKRVKKWTYEILNYPDKPEGVYADLLIYDGRVIGGDIHSNELDGFLHGFDRNLIGNNQLPSSSAPPAASEEPSAASSVPSAGESALSDSSAAPGEPGE